MLNDPTILNQLSKLYQLNPEATLNKLLSATGRSTADNALQRLNLLNQASGLDSGAASKRHASAPSQSQLSGQKAPIPLNASSFLP